MVDPRGIRSWILRGREQKWGSLCLAKSFGHRSKTAHCAVFSLRSIPLILCNEKITREHSKEHSLAIFWWTRGESNPCPKTSWYDLLRGQSVFISSHYAPPTDRQHAVRSTFVLDRFRCDRRCKFTTTITLSPQSWSSAEERVTRRSQHCQLKRPKARQLGSHSNRIVVV